MVLLILKNHVSLTLFQMREENIRRVIVVGTAHSSDRRAPTPPLEITERAVMICRKVADFNVRFFQALTTGEVEKAKEMATQVRTLESMNSKTNFFSAGTTALLFWRRYQISTNLLGHFRVVGYTSCWRFRRKTERNIHYSGTRYIFLIKILQKYMRVLVSYMREGYRMQVRVFN